MVDCDKSVDCDTVGLYHQSNLINPDHFLSRIAAKTPGFSYGDIRADIGVGKQTVRNGVRTWSVHTNLGYILP